MTKQEALIRSIVGPARCEVRTFACAVNITRHLLFCENLAQDDILVTKHIYPEVAARTGKSCTAVSRQIERMENLCWEHLGSEGQLTYIGKQLKDIRSPSDMLFYLAYYCHFNMPYYEVLREKPELLFGSAAKEISDVRTSQAFRAKASD